MARPGLRTYLASTGPSETGTTEIESRRHSLPTWLDGLILLAIAGLMAALTWRGWADPVVDFGRELYVPWRLSEGARLYTDIAWFNGPLSQYWNAAWFRLLGPSMTTLFVANVFVLGAMVVLLRGLIDEIAGRCAALLAALLFLLVFAFGQYVGIANYNWIAPYAHELTHGVMLAVASVAALSKWRRDGNPRMLAAGGFLLGLCFLTKVETFLAGAVGSAVLLAPLVRSSERRARATWAVAFAVPIVGSLAGVGVVPTLGAWPSVLAGEVAELPFYRAGMGLDDPRLRIEETGAWAVIWAIGLAIPLSAAWLARETRSRVALPLTAVISGVVLLGAGDRIPWTESLRPLQLFVFLLVLALGVARLRGRGPDGAPIESDSGRHAVQTALALGLLSLVLLLKMLLNVRSGHYGFALAVPAAAFSVAALWRWLPAVVDRAGMRGDVVRGAVLALLALFCLTHVRTTMGWMEGKTDVVGSGPDTFRTDLRGAFVQLAVDHVREAGYRSVAVLPEGVMINYLARVPNPTPYLNFMPPEEILFGDAAWEAAFRAAPPDAIVIVPKDTAEFGRGAFGIGYGTRLMEWIASEYVPLTALRIDGVNYQIRLLVRRNRPT